MMCMYMGDSVECGENATLKTNHQNAIYKIIPANLIYIHVQHLTPGI